MTRCVHWAWVCAMFVASSPAYAQGTLPLASARIKVQVLSDSGPVEGARVTAGNQRITTSSAGEAVLTVEAGAVEIAIDRTGYLPQTIRAVAQTGTETIVVVRLQTQPEMKEEVTVSATRANVRLQDEPLRVEVLGRDEVEEKLLMTPGDIAMLLNETAGLRVQVTSPSLGAASLRVQGLRGRYTQLLADGLPLYGGQSGSIGLLQIPPMDLGQVEVIKGVASSLFGSSALGGVINLVSRQPAATAEHELLFNQTTQGGTDGMLWSSGPLSRQWGYTLLIGADRQARHDVDDDGWADLPGVTRLSARPRFFWNNHAGRSLFVTVGLLAENRIGGTLPGEIVPDGNGFQESLRTGREDTGVVAHLLVGKNVLGVRGSVTAQQHRHGFGEVIEHDGHHTAFGEISLTGTRRQHTWVIGGAMQSDAYRNRSVPRFDYTYWTPSIFAQDDFAPVASLRVSLSARLDHHNAFGSFASPRVSALWRFAPEWTLRGSVGTGYFAPTPLTEETEAVGLTRLHAADLGRAERARSVSTDLSRTIGPVELTATAFGSRVTGTLDVTPASSSDGYDLVRLQAPTRTIGAELLATIRYREITIVGTHTFVHANEPDALTGQRVDVALTPKHASGLVLMWEREGESRVGVEMYYTGRQRLDDNPYRAASVPYLYFGAMAERRVGRYRVFVNSENLSDRRQTRFDSLLRRVRRFDGRWTVDAWAPLEGLVVNAGLRLAF